MRYVVTGSAGFIGHHLCAALLERGHRVEGIDSFTDYYDPSIKRARAARLDREAGCRGFELDLAHADLDGLVEGADAVIHLAGQPGVRLSWADSFPVYVERNITASQRVLEAGRRCRVPRLVLASSSSVYGNAATYPTTEESPTRPFSPYGVTKLAMEQLARAYADNWGLPVVVLRYFTVYGPGQRPDMGLYRFIAQAAAGEAVTVFGDGAQVRDFTYVSDAVEATILAAQADVPAASVFNVAGGSSSSVNDVLRLVSETVGRDIVRHHVPDQPGDVRVTGGSIERAGRTLGWQPQVSLADGVKEQVADQLRGDTDW